MSRHLLPILSACAFLASCTAPISVKTITPAPPHAVANDPITLLQAKRVNRSEPARNAGRILTALRNAAKQVETGNHSAIPEYNYLTARLVDQLIAMDIRPWQRQVEIPVGDTRYIVRGNQPADLRANPSDKPRKFVSTDRFIFEGRWATNRPNKYGIGAPVVAFLPVEDQKRAHPDDKIRYRNLTALVRFDGNHASLSLEDPYRTRSVSFGKQSIPLAADFGANVSLALSKERVDKIGLARLLNPGDYDNTFHISRFQPDDPALTPVLLIHGLQDTPASWMPMYLELIADPEIREHYQFWAFSYPSGYPFPYSASILRKELARMRRLHPHHDDIVVIGHSMGGLITRTLVTDAGESIWKKTFETPPSKTPVSGESRTILEESLIFNAEKNIHRAIFLSTPHRGSVLASNWIGRLGTKLVHLPNTLADIRDNLANMAVRDQAGVHLDHVPSSIDTLNPKSPFLRHINEIPIRPKVTYHSIIGDRGKEDTPDSSDGVVAYWSSHLDGAASEIIIPTNHSTQIHPDSIEEVRRILHLHAGIPYTYQAPSLPEAPNRHLKYGTPSRR